MQTPQMCVDAQTYAERNVSGRAGMRQVMPTRPCMGGQYRPCKPSTPSRKAPECEVDDPEGNLVIVEKCACREAIRLPEAEG